MVRLASRILLIILFSLSGLAGCGRKTLPVPPSAVIPKAINNLNYSQDESRVILSWTYPGETTIGTELKTIEGFQIFRAVVPEKDFCETCPVSFSSTVEVAFDQAVQDRKNKRAAYTETVLRPGHRYVYKVRTKAGWRIISDDSNIISFLWEAPASAPTSVQLIPEDRQVSLSWRKVATRTDGTSLAMAPKYQVYRSADDRGFKPVGEAVSGTEYRDMGLVNGRLYEYKVRAVATRGESRISGIASSVVSGRPQDLTPPIPPHNLVVVKVVDGVKIIWARGVEPDIAGYKVFRRTETGDERVFIGETGVSQTFFVDKNAPASQRLLYSITSFDRARPANESMFSKEVQYEPF
jgi:fibronectin type 3 domain-containing protein/predicted small lipoprotein YifL